MLVSQLVQFNSFEKVYDTFGLLTFLDFETVKYLFLLGKRL